MTPAATDTQTSDDASRPVRVIAVGRTALAGIDAVLRKDRAVELIRAKTAFAAIGEAASPMDESSPSELTVIVSPEAVPAERSAAFAKAIRRIDELALLLNIGERAMEGFDGAVGQGADVRTMVRRGAGALAADEVTGVIDQTPIEAAGEQANDSPTPAIALATGRDPVAAALEALKARWNLTSAQLVTTGDAGAEVAFNGRVVGRLITDPPLPAEAAGREAEAIAPWVVLARQQEQLRHAAFTDELTGAWNRRYFNRFLAAAIASAADKRHTVTLLVFDVDNFKVYNDRFGHSAGDEILLEAVRLLNTCIRPTDRVCRVGGDEFAVVFHDPAGPRGGGGGPTSPQSIAEIVRRIQKAICDHRFPKLSELAPGTLTISGGMATFPWDGRTVSQLMDKADALAMQSKREGKNKIAFGPGAAQVCGQ